MSADNDEQKNEFNFSTFRKSLEVKAASTEKKVVVDLDEYYRQQRNGKMEDQKKRAEAENNLHAFHKVSNALLPLEDDDNVFTGSDEDDVDDENINEDDDNVVVDNEIGAMGKFADNSRENDKSGVLKYIGTILVTLGIFNESQEMRRLTSLPMVYNQNTEQNDRLQSLMSAMFLRKYRPSLFIGTRSMLNSVVAYMRPGPKDQDRIREEVQMTRDGASIALDWEFPKGSKSIKTYMGNGSLSESVVLVLHGVNTNTSFGYIRSMMNSCTNNGYIAVGMNSRGCGGVELQTPRYGNAAYTNDLRNIVEVLCHRLSPDAKLFLVGFSLGANILVKYLGESGFSGKQLPKNIAGAVSLCNPMVINHERLKSPWSHLLSLGAKKRWLRHRKSTAKMTCKNYQDALKNAYLHSHKLAEMTSHMLPHMLRNSSQYPFENYIGYQSLQEYWNDASSENFIAHVPVPLLVCFATDDKISHNTIAAMNSCLSNPNVILVKTSSGGHLGFHTSKRLNPFGSWDLKSLNEVDKSWADKLAVQFMNAVMKMDHYDMVLESRKEAARHCRALSTNIQSKL